MEIDIQEVSKIEKPTVKGLLETIPSGIGLDISKNHTGIVIWNGTSIEEYGFAISLYDKGDYFAEYKMRQEFKQKLSQIVKGRHFEYCIVEDVYGGENFDTVRKLLALQTVMDELIFESVCTVGTFVRWLETTWSKYTRRLYKQAGRLKSKIETQNLLEYLEYDFYLTNKDLSEVKKKEIFFEDKCDACAMLLGLICSLIYKEEPNKIVKPTLKDLKLVYVENKEDITKNRDKNLKACLNSALDMTLPCKKLKSEILGLIIQYPGDILRIEIPVSKLGLFGIEQKFNFYESGKGYLYVYNRKTYNIS